MRTSRPVSLAAPAARPALAAMVASALFAGGLAADATRAQAGPTGVARHAAAPMHAGWASPQAGAEGLASTRRVIAGGGGSSSGGAFRIDGTIGQSDADPLHPTSGGVFAITGGFWPGIAAPPPPGEDLFADGFEPLPP